MRFGPNVDPVPSWGGSIDHEFDRNSVSVELAPGLLKAHQTKHRPRAVKPKLA